MEVEGNPVPGARVVINECALEPDVEAEAQWQAKQEARRSRLAQEKEEEKRRRLEEEQAYVHVAPVQGCSSTYIYHIFIVAFPFPGDVQNHFTMSGFTICVQLYY